MKLSSLAVKKDTAPTKKAKSEIQLPILEGKIGRLNALKKAIDEADAEKKMIESEVKSAALSVWVKEYAVGKCRPENFIVVDKTGAKTMLIVMDKYSAVTPEKKEVLEAMMPTALETKTTYTLNPELLQQYGDKIADAILGLDIPDEDKAKLLIEEEKTTIISGCIDKALSLSNDIEQTISLIQPVLALKPQR